MRTKLAFVKIAVALAVVATFTAAGGPVTASVRPAAKTTTVVLDGWASTPSEPAALKKVLSSFEKANKTIHVQYNVINGTFQTQMAAAFAAGRGPDVLYADEGWAQQFERAGEFQPLQKYAAKDKSFDMGDFYSGLLNGFKIGKNIYGFPKDYSTLATWYNPQMLKAVHVSHVPTDVNSFARVACEIRKYEVKHGHKNTYGAGLPNDQARFQPILQAYGGRVLNAKETKSEFNSSAAVKAVGWWAGLVKKGCAAEPSQVGATWSGQEYGQKNAAMVFEGPWLLSPMQTTWKGVPYKLAPLPTGPKGNGNLSFSVAYAMNAKSKVKPEAWKLISYLTGKVGESQWVKLFKVLPARKSIKPPPGDGVFVKGAQYAQPWTFKPGYFNAGGPNTTLNNDLDKVAKGQMTAKQAVADTSNAIKRWLANP